jgi:ketosteroid isomerase-like protein
MAISGRELVDQMGELMSTGGVEALVAMYAEDAEVVLYHRVACGHDEIRRLLGASLASHGLYKVISIDQFQETGDIVMWDATVEREEGILETTHIVMRDGDGLIRRHIPRIRGYWGM